MRKSVLTLTSLLALTLAGACANNNFDPGDPRLMTARLSIVGSSAVTLRYADTANLRVRYEADDGTAIENAPLSYEIIGEGGGSRLAAFETVTDVAGEATMTLTAGNAAANFNVRVTPPQGDAVEFNVAVSDSDAGSIVVTMTYGGMRDLVRFDTFLFTGESCASMNPLMLPTATRSAPSVSTLDAMPGFAGVPVAANYAVAVVARNGSAVAAFGCRDNVAVRNREETPVNITLTDTEIPPSFVGVFDLDNRFDFGDALPGAVATVLDVLTELGDDNPPEGQLVELFADSDGDGRAEYGRDPGAFIVELAARQTCAWDCDPSITEDKPEGWEMCAPGDHALGDARYIFDGGLNSRESRARFTGGCGAWDVAGELVQDQVNEQLASLLPSFVFDWTNLASDLASAITNAHILSVLTVNGASAGNEFVLPMNHELVQMVVDFRNPRSDPPGMIETRTFSLAEAGLTGLEVNEMTTVDGTTLMIPEHSFALNWGQLVLYVYRNVLLQEIFGVSSTSDLIASWVDCMAVGEWVATQAPIVSATTAAGYCNTAISLAGGLLEAQLADLLDVDGTLTIGGTAVGADIDESTGRVDSLVNGMWSGCFNDDGTEECTASTAEDVTATFTGVRRGTGG